MPSQSVFSPPGSSSSWPALPNWQSGLLGPSPQWCPNCHTNQHHLSQCPHRFTGPSTAPPFAGAHFLGDPNWYPDTGATHHMTAMPLQHSQSYGGPYNVYMGNGDSMPVTHSGNLPFSIGNSKFSLESVLCIPSIRKNLLSVARFTKDNLVHTTTDLLKFVLLSSPVPPQAHLPSPLSSPSDVGPSHVPSPSEGVDFSTVPTSLASQPISPAPRLPTHAPPSEPVLPQSSPAGPVVQYTCRRQIQSIPVPPNPAASSAAGLSSGPPLPDPSSANQVAPAPIPPPNAPLPHVSAPSPAAAPDAAPMPQVSAPPPRPSMVTHLREGIVQPRQQTDGTVAILYLVLFSPWWNLLNPPITPKLPKNRNGVRP
ncbi:protein transport protein SEC31-like [Rosa chinensis]|uniref:protein transport protein SEC31-like n=1 Tax=Rosa chinensis TaxID=74649 RepID=UPI000D0931A7|nr:protein transport protein SEC31-like [Rosa chinensis]